ncbi:hypothetical protein K438DRAFT_2143063 [Mycena galopus ATCC 62051]|nr:hypothetical protein K438DRAFT_2143063 [Mycena galopus ATCC 62051]
MAHPRRTLHDKTSYSILPTPPSPKRITSPSPSLSPSNSNSAGSTTEPTTPPSQPRGRVRKLYPEGVGRVPLHRRGTSKTYERLEDLLREAGYKETRIFTPETERTVPQEETKSPKIGAAFVGFLSNFVPSRSASVKREEEEPEVVYAPPPSPLVNRTPRPNASHATRSSEHKRASAILRTEGPTQRRGSKADEPSGSSSVAPRRSVADMQQQQQQQRQRVDSVVAPLPSDMPPLHHPRPVNRYYQHHPSSSRASGVVSPPPQPTHHPTPTRASTYLRHMTSFDQARPQSTPPASAYARVTDDAEEESLLSPTLAPRMPTGWMDNVKRARDYFAPLPLPQSNSSSSLMSTSPAPTLKPGLGLGRSVSAKTRGRLSDRTNAHANPNTPAPPLLTARLSSGRAKRSESQVSVGRVVCRSRGSSPVRHGHGHKDKDKDKGKGKDLDLRGHLEIPGPDELNLALARSRFLSGWGTSSAHAGAQLLSPPRRRDVSAGFDSGSDVSDVSSEGEEELTLERMLVPSRHAYNRPAAMERSRSVRSLRRCLELDGGGQGEVPPVPPLPVEGNGNGSKRWSLSLSWGRAREAPQHSDAEDAEVYLGAAERGSTRQRQRPVLPSWAN